MRSITCRKCGESLDETHKGWNEACSTGTCPCCGRLLDLAVEMDVTSRSEDAGVSGRAKKVGSKLVYSGLFTLGLALLLGPMGGPGGLLIFLLIVGIPLLVYGLACSSREQRGQELQKVMAGSGFSGLLVRSGMALFVLSIFIKLGGIVVNERQIVELSRYGILGGMIASALGVLMAAFGDVSS